VKLTDKKPLVYLISDGSITNENYAARSRSFLDLVAAAVSSNIQLVQIREKHLSARKLFDLAIATRKVCKDSNSSLLVNDRIDIALAARVDGVHLTSQSVRAEIVRQFVPQNFLIGVSTHTEHELVLAKNGGADFAVFGPVFESPGKGRCLGVEELSSAVAMAGSFPVLALGGVDGTNYADAINTGAAGFAAIRFLNNAENLRMLKTDLGL